MSEFLAEAKVLITPDTTKFRAQLQAQLSAATSSLKPITVPVVPVAATGAAALTTQNKALAQSLAQTAGAQEVLTKTTQGSTSAMLGASSASAKLDAALLGLRTAAGSTAVIGLGAMALAAIVLGKALRSILVDTAAFEQELNTFQATTGASAEQMERVSAAAERLGADVRLPAVSAADAAVAFTELAKAGLSIEDALAGAEGVLQLATAAQISNAEASQIAANALNSFGLAGEDATKVADDLANAANASQGSISDMALALRQSSAVAKQVGLDLEDTTAILSLFAKNGLQGSDAGTSLRVALIRLVAPTQKAADEIRKLGLQIRDAQGNLRADVFAQFGEATRDLTPAARDASAALIFGQDAIRAVSIGAREGAEGLRLMQFQIDQAGTAAELAGARTEGLAGAFSGLQSNLQTVGIQLGSFVVGPLTNLLQHATDAVGVVGELVGALQGLAKIKIPPIEIPLLFKTPGGTAGGLAETIISETSKTILSGGIAGRVGIALGKDLFKDLTEGSREAEERLERLNFQLQALQSARVAAAQSGDFARAGQLSLQIERLQKQVKAVKDEINGVTTRPFEDLRGSVERAVEELTKVRDFRLDKGIVTDTTFLNQRIDILNRTLSVFDLAGKKALGSQESLRAAIVGTGVASLEAARNIKTMVDAMTALTRQSTVLGDKLQKLQAEGAGPAAQIAVLQEDIRVQQDIIAQAEKGGRQAGDITAIRKARAKIIADNAEIESLQNEIAADQREATNKAKKAADDAAKLAEEQTKAFIEAFGGGRQRRLRQAELAAGLTEDARDDLAVDRKIKAFLLAKRKAIRDRIRELQLHGAALRAARDAIKKLNDEIDRINNEIAQDQQDVGQQQAQSIQLDIDLAVTQGNTRKEIAARRRLIKLLQQQLALTKKGTLEYKRLRNAIAEQNEAIEDLNKEKEKQGKTLAQSQFEFMQSLQGFSTNLLGNLIPGFATGGLVGPGSGQTARPLDVGGAPQERVAQADAVRSAQDRGVRPIQVDTTNQLLSQILRTLQGHHAGTGHPEIVHNRRVGAALMDTLGTVHGA